ncbi:hypothetical protein PENTCL1PPCAC_563, partial [Pristionchus entomophagus]
GLIAASLLFVFSECSQKWDTKWDKNVILGGPEENMGDKRVVGDAPKGNGVCYWQGGFWCNPGNYCEEGYRYVSQHKQSTYSQFAGESGALCWMGTRYLCCLEGHVKKDPLTSCREGSGPSCKGDEQLLTFASWTNANKCCDAGTIVE